MNVRPETTAFALASLMPVADAALRRAAVFGDRTRLQQGMPVPAWGQAEPAERFEIAAPTAVRYAWADNPESCNLVNRAGLPASPFRTDGPSGPRRPY